jgi:hypothetical protein
MSEETKTEESRELTEDERKSIAFYESEMRGWSEALCKSLADGLRSSEVGEPIVVTTETTYDSPLLREMLATLVENIGTMPRCPVKGQPSGGGAAQYVQMFAMIVQGAINALADAKKSKTAPPGGAKEPPAPATG